MSKKVYPGTQAILRTVKLLETFSDQQPEWYLPELSQATGLNRTTTYRILSALESAGLVAYNPANDKYRLGSEIIVLGARALRANPLRTIAQPVLQQLAKTTGEMASLETLEGDKSMILAEVKGQNQRRLSTSIGNLWPAHATSTGKVLLAHLPAAEQQTLLADPLPRLTPHTITNKADLILRLNQVKTQGYAVAVNELEVG
ncbi:MAG: IclR family transcriptional regulator, partial [Anaerolineae bacterium]|nr:IclR family transcriptional regulator [Anaerolineae bacterium]